MNLSLKEGNELVKKLTEYTDYTDRKGVEVVVAPPFLHLYEACKLAENSKLSIAAQDGNGNDNGAHTGEVSVSMLKEAGTELIIVGHSERRQFYGDTDAVINAKLKQVIGANLMPILCLGESLEDRKKGEHESVVAGQLEAALKGFSDDDLENTIIAYEPVWAIGTGETATPDQAQDMHQFIRKYLSNKYSATVAHEISLLYGGSVKPGNAYELFSEPDIDGGLIGGASLDYDQFVAIIKAGIQVLR